MARFFFNVTDGSVFLDPVGTDLDGLEAVREEAIRASAELLRGLGAETDFWKGEDWTMSVVDEGGAPVLSLCFTSRSPAVSLPPPPNIFAALLKEP